MKKITNKEQCKINALRQMEIEIISMDSNKFVGYCHQDGSNIFANNLITYEGEECIAFYKELERQNDK